VNRNAPLGALLAWVVFLSPASASWHAWFQRGTLDKVNAQLQGQVIDYTNNHGTDRRIWSSALHQRRDLYVYLPPGFDPCQRYPALLWLHGFSQDELSFLQYVVKPLDQAIASGKIPPVIIAAPDGSLRGRPQLINGGSFFVNSKAGNYEDFLIQDVWHFLVTNYPIRPEREAHVLAGISMGGGAAYNLGIKYRDCFGVVLGVFPPVNNRWIDCHGKYMANFDPCCWGWREKTGLGCEVVGRFYGVFMVHLGQVIGPLYGLGPKAIEALSRENPIEMIDSYHLHEGELAMYIGYGGQDQFNIDAQVESFLHRARERGLSVRVGYEPEGKHDAATAMKLFPDILDWLGPLLAPYCPAPCPIGGG
jgi:S-formylglutathione hydrolase FrmB